MATPRTQLGYHTVAIPPDRLAEAAVRVEELGLDAVWMAETRHDPFVGLAGAAARTSRVGLSTGLAVAFARSPMTTAMAANDLQLVSRGRFSLGLGSQMKTHIVRRFGMPWSEPAARMREYVLAVRAIWEAFATGQRLRFRGRFYRHTLMHPFFNPGPNPFGNPPILLGGVGPLMTRTAGEVADGFIAHTIATPRYLREVARPLLAAGRAETGCTLEGFRIHATPIVVTGRDEAEYAASADFAREQIAKYAAIPTYADIIDAEGFADLRTDLQSLAADGRWTELKDAVDESALQTFAVVGEPGEIGRAVYERLGSLATSMALYQYEGGDPEHLCDAYAAYRRAEDAAESLPVAG